MRPILVVSVMLFGASAAFAQQFDSIIDRVQRTSGRIETFSADAYVYEYYG